MIAREKARDERHAHNDDERPGAAITVPIPEPYSNKLAVLEERFAVITFDVGPGDHFQFIYTGLTEG